MTMTKIRLGHHPVTGNPLYHYHAPDSHVVIVGPITGSATLKDGTSYNLDDDVVEVKNERHAEELAFIVGERYAEEGHPAHTDGTPFVHNHPKAAKR